MNSPENTQENTPDWKLRLDERNAKGHLQYVREEVMKIGSKLMSLLKEVHDRRSYRFDYLTFEDYCEKEWQIGRKRAYQILKGASFRELILSNEECLHTLDTDGREALDDLNTHQLKTLSQAQPVQAVQILKKLAATGEKITANKIARELGMTKPQGKTHKCPHCGGKGRVPLGEDEEVAPVIHNETEM